MKAKPTKHPGEVLLQVNRRDEPMLEAASARGGATPFRLQRILVPIDFSECSKEALRYALPLAKQHQAALTLVYVLPSPTYPVGEYGGVPASSIEAETRAKSERELTELANDEVRGAVPAAVQVRTGSPAVEIIALANGLPADLIVISTHGRTGLTHVFLGSVVERVVQRAPCPVLVVRQNEREILAD